MTSAAESANQSAKQIAQSKPVRVGARVGILSYGITHLLIAGLAIQVALGDKGEKADQSGAFESLAQNGFGKAVLWVLALGFIATALWRLTQAIWGFSYESDDKRKIRKRAISGFKVVVFVALAVLAVSTAVGSGGGGGGQQGATAGALSLPGGQFIVGAVGLGVIAAGVVKIVEGWQKKFRDDMDLPADERARQAAVRSGQIGFIAKGASIVLIGVLVVVAAVQFDPAESSGLDAALKTLAAQPFGAILLIIMGLGLAAYGVFCFFDARYHRI